MKVVGLITEYNPFHKGHLYHIEKAKEITGADCCIAVMSGNYVQRGTPAIFDKYLRTRMALSCGLDAVLELPLPFACGSAEFFASGAVSLLNSLGCVDYLCFGSEAGDMQLFGVVAPVLAEEPAIYKEALQDGLRQGLTFPAARRQAIIHYLEMLESPVPLCQLDEFLASPNNILGLEYCKAIIRQRASLIPVTIARKGQGYHSQQTGETYSSASAIRSILENESCADLSSVNASMPLTVYDLLVNHIDINGPVTADDFSLLLKYKLMEETADTLTQYWDMTEELAARIYRCLNQYTTYNEFAQLLKTKDITLTRMNRALLHVVLGLTKDAVPTTAEYARILGFAKGTPVLKEIKNKAKIPIITKAADAEKMLSKDILVHWEQDIKAANLYETVAAYKFKRKFVHEYQQGIVMV